MNFISYPVFLIIQVVLALVLIAVTFSNGLENASLLALIGFGAVQLLLVVLSKNKKYLDAINLLDIRITTLGLFVIALLLTFSPYLLSFTQNTLLVGTTTAVATITLVSFLFADLTLQDQDTID